MGFDGIRPVQMHRPRRLNRRAGGASRDRGSSSRSPRSTSSVVSSIGMPSRSIRCFALAHFVAAILERRVLAARAPLLADLAQPLRMDRQPEQPVLVRQHRRAAARGRRSRRASAENSPRGCRTAARDRATSASCRSAKRRPGSPAPAELARGGAVVVRLREVDRVHPREVLVAVGDAVRAAGRVRALRAELGLERRR